LFRRRKSDEAVAEAARESERRALFEQLAQRPDNVCPFLALADDRVAYRAEPNDEHRCYAFGDPAPLSTEQQSRVCLQRGYGNCPRYLRGILVIPTEELEALRRPQPMPAPPAEPVAHAAERRRRGAPLALVGLLVLLLLVGGGAAFLLTRPGPVAVVTPSASVDATPTASATPTPTLTASASSTPLASPTPEPTPVAGDVFDHFEVSVAPGTYTIFRLDGAGNVVASLPAEFHSYSQAIVREVTAPRHSWLVENGGYSGYSYLADQSGPFRIRKVYHGPNGERRSELIPDDQR
jgi:hypothetical protein